jgi:ribulose-phosphate 3-epimerase
MIRLAPSILSADFANLERDIKCVQDAGAKVMHIDVMDGHFVPNITIGPPVVKAIRKHITGIMDVHLMIENPERYLEDFKDAGADILTVHIEATKHIHRVVQQIKALGMKAGVALNPGTPVSALDCILSDIDLVLIMTVNPGFGGQKFIPYSLKKLEEITDRISRLDKEIIVEVDGGIDLTNIEMVIQKGAHWLVAGSSVYQAPDINERMSSFSQIISKYDDSL